MFGLELSFIWAGIIALSVLIYVILDGFDFGFGLLFPLSKDESERDVMMNSVAPIWDGNETWLVLGGGGLLAVFPLAYATVLPALYMPIILMLLGLIFRGVAFEYRWRTTRWKPLWMSRSSADHWLPRCVRALPWVPWCRVSISRIAPMQVAGGTG